jgi:uncharacterized membrane protein YqgA involved in biofilm formation
LLGTIVNAVAVLVGALLGSVAGARLPEGVRRAALGGVGLAVLLIGLDMSLRARGNTLVTVASLALGGAAGKALAIQGRLDDLGRAAQSRLAALGAGAARGFVLASLVFCVGPMAVVGALQSALEGRHAVLFAKSALDGTTAAIFAAAMGPGVALSALTVLAYQGGLVLLAGAVRPLLADPLVMGSLLETGGLLIVAISLALLGLADLGTADYLPALLLAVALAWAVRASGVTLP